MLSSRVSVVSGMLLSAALGMIWRGARSCEAQRESSLSAGQLVPGSSTVTTITANFSAARDQPLLKDKIGVYQTPFMGTRGLPSLLAMQPFLHEAGVRDLRYEMGWGKPDTYAYAQIGGTVSEPKIDFTKLDPFLRMLHANGVEPLLAVGYDPLPLQVCGSTNKNCWKNPPASYSGWQSILKQIARHYDTTLGIGGIQYEVWNEPDLVSGGSKAFFDGGPSEYGGMFKYGVDGVKGGASNSAGTADALGGGPAIAYNTTYITQSGMLQQPVDFFSIHSYANYSKQIDALRSEVDSSSPLYVTEYGSYSTFGIKGPISTHAGAMRFLADVATMLDDPGVPKIYWAQWIDDSLGMITYSLHRKAIFNAYKIYETMLPVDRVRTSISGMTAGIGSMAAVDPHTAGIVVWNSTAVARPVAVELRQLPFARGKLTQWYIDRQHASFEDDAPEDLTSGGDSSAAVKGRAARWSGTIQPQSLIYIHITDGSANLLKKNSIGTYEGDHYYFPPSEYSLR